MSTPQQLPPAIEIFRPGVLIDDAGVERTFTADDIKAMAEGYDPALREAPLCVGHPAGDMPAYGWVQRLAVNKAGRLTMDPHQVEPQFAEMVGAGRFKKRSAAFYPPQHPSNPKPGTWYLRHVAFLGAQPPAVSGLKDIQFAEADQGCVCFSECDPQQPTHTTQELSMDEKERLAKAEAAAAAEKEAREKAEKEAAAAKAELAQFAERQRKDRHAGFVQFAEGQMKVGALTKPEAAALPEVLAALADAQPVEFSEGGATKKVSPAQWLQDFVSTRSPVVQFGEFTPGAGGQESVKGKSDAEIDAAAKEYARKHNVQYAEAVKAVVGFTA